MIGRKTNGGLVMMSSPEMPPPLLGRTPDAGGLLEGEAEGEGDSNGVGVAGSGVGVACRVKVAHGLGCTLAQSLCTPGLSSARGFKTLVNAPLSSVTRVAAMCVVTSQYRLRLSFLRKLWPVTVMLMVITPPVGCSPIEASLGRGAYTTAAGPVADLELVALTLNV
jgi:hypothetical protein